MSVILDTPFIFDDTVTDLQISFRARPVDCGRLLAVDVPRLDTGLLFMVRCGVSNAYMFTAADGISLTVTAAAFAVVKYGIRHIRKTPRAAFRCLQITSPLVRRVSVLRL